ncbi:hypothetical protein [Croceicoccus mobilis]|uniref:Uncharacterized protein n=1 Tax=Croceicoccus mobilis TaxID=1703339 RepID=A0A916Z2L9_9SPHN|nr:hypothetical protein [Croceicoccus mobilis]GGD73832.1 hypothetical protein GCM10010990_24310 [Croceicoccus mobilis]
MTIGAGMMAKLIIAGYFALVGVAAVLVFLALARIACRARASIISRVGAPLPDIPAPTELWWCAMGLTLGGAAIAGMLSTILRLDLLPPFFGGLLQWHDAPWMQFARVYLALIVLVMFVMRLAPHPRWKLGWCVLWTLWCMAWVMVLR